MNAEEIAFLFAAGTLAGGINSVAGGGGFVAFPALVFTGAPPLLANSTQTVALWPGIVASSGAYRKQWESIQHEHVSLTSLIVVSMLGGLFGARLLLKTPETTFSHLVPWLLLVATLLFAFGDRLRRPGLAFRGSAPMRALALMTQFVTAVYGGYFGAGLGILMLALLSMLGMRDIHAMNAVKSVLGAAINLVALLTFVLAGAVIWPKAVPMLAGAITGGYLGAHYAQKTDPKIVRGIVIVIGAGMTIYFFATTS